MHIRLAAPLLLALATCAPLAAVDAPAPALAAVEWRVADGRDVPGPVKAALIAESEKQAAGEDVLGFTYYQTSFDTKEAHFKAEFRAGAKQWTVLCKPDGTIESSTGKAADAADGEPSGHAKPVPGPKAPEP